MLLVQLIRLMMLISLICIIRRTSMARVKILNSVSEGQEGKCCLYFQWCLYIYDEGEPQKGYRFIWRRPDGTLQAARGQARLPSIAKAQRLMARAVEEGWGNFTDDEA